MKKRLSKMDIWVLAVVLALIAGVFVRGRLVRRMPGTERYTYQMELSDVEGSITPGDSVLCIIGKQSMGIVTDVRTEADRMVLTLEAEGFPIEGGIHTNVYDILSGFEGQFYTETASWNGIIISVPEVIS